MHWYAGPWREHAEAGKGLKMLASISWQRSPRRLPTGCRGLFLSSFTNASGLRFNAARVPSPDP